MNDIEKITKKIEKKIPLSYEELKPILRPKGIQNGVIAVDAARCKGCGLCIKNCPFKCWELDENKIARLKSGYTCFSCFNCIVACPEKALSIVSNFRIDGGYYDTGFSPTKMPLEPEDEKGKPAEWNEIEKTILNRRSVRNFKKDPVPEPLIRRVLEAGRFAPSAGNHQPWKFTVVTNKKFIDEMEQAAYKLCKGLYDLYTNDATAVKAFEIVGGTLPAVVFEYRVMLGGFAAVVRKDLPIFLNAPCVIFLGANKKLSGPELQIGICGENMNLAALSLGLGCCWSNFGREVENVPEIKAKLGFGEDWKIITTMCLGYPQFKQKGIVPRMFRPVTWIREGSDVPQVEE